jgi:hypothetical protein
MLCWEMSLFSEVHTKHINTLCGQNVDCQNVKPDGIIKYPLGFKGLQRLAVNLLQNSFFSVRTHLLHHFCEFWKRSVNSVLGIARTASLLCVHLSPHR